MVLVGLPPTAGAVQEKGEDPSGHAVDLSSLRPQVFSADAQGAVCELPARSGRQAGVCLDSSEGLQAQLPFCGSSIRYRACVPANQPLFPDSTAAVKDKQLALLFKDIVEKRLAMEMNITPDVYVDIRFLSNAKCIDQLRNVLCWYNFPKCDDDNVSLPLCRSSCEQYYSKCKYSADPDGLHTPCRAAEVAQRGLFASQSPGPDQVLGENDAICRSTERLMDSVLASRPPEAPWALSMPGLLVVGGSAFTIISIIVYLLVPEGLRVYSGWALKYVLTRPIWLWRVWPLLQGGTVIALLVLVILALLGWGLGVRLNGGFDRFSSTTTTTTTTQVNGTTKAPFVPPEAAFNLQTRLPLTTEQVAQLLGSCTCTGAAPRFARPSLAGLVAATAAALLSLPARTPDLAAA